MEQQKIIAAAFRVWGRQLYQSTSLTEVAEELGVSKPALYRHFKNKEALFVALYEDFFDRYAAFIKPSYEKALGLLPNARECFSLILRAIAEYFIRNIYDFVFFVVQVFGCDSANREKLDCLLVARGIDMRVFQAVDKGQPSKLLMSTATLFFIIARFHKWNIQQRLEPNEVQTQGLCNFVVHKIEQGLDFNQEMRARIEKLDLAALEGLLEKNLDFSYNKAGDREGEIFEAAGAALAEAGPWKLSMDAVAKRLGLSKSSLYCHFKSREDLLQRFFVREFNRFLDSASAGKKLAAEPEAQFYLIISAMAHYLRSNHNLLKTINWFRTRTDELVVKWSKKRVGEENFDSSRFHLLFSDIFSYFSNFSESMRKMNQEDNERLSANIIPFLIVNILMHGNNENSAFRGLFRFLTLGIG